jgi:hypothetical protein
MTANENIPWKRLSVEATAIVGSILLAFAIDAWWDDFQQRKQTHTLLTDLEAVFAENVSLIDENIELVNKYQGILKHFISVESDGAALISPELTFDTLQSIWRPVTTPNNNSILIAKFDSADVDLSIHPLLQDAIAEWRSEVIELDERRELLVENESDALLAIGRHPEIGLVWAEIASGVLPLGGNPQLSDSLMRNAREDKDVMALAARKSWHNRIHLNALRRNRETSVAVLDLIQVALDE